jgi:hypothetical protein
VKSSSTNTGMSDSDNNEGDNLDGIKSVLESITSVFDSKKNLDSLKASYSCTASLLSIHLLKLSKNLMPQRVTALTITFTSTLETRHQELEACLHLANLLPPLFAHQTHQCSSKVR